MPNSFPVTIGWGWKAGGAAVSNTSGNITSSVSVNQEAGFSIVSYTGNGSNGQTVGHGLGKKPAWIILKNRDATQNWRVWHKSLASDGSKRLLLDAVNASEDAGFLNDTAPTSTVFTLGNADDAWNANGNKFIAYCWAEIPGYSKFGEYKGTGNSNGSFINVGFKPAFVLVKGKGFAGNWNLFDIKRPGVNPTNDRLFPNLNNSETDGSSSNNQIDILANGFKIRGSNVDTNSAGSTYLYMAFAEQTSLNQYNLAVNGF